MNTKNSIYISIFIILIFILIILIGRIFFDSVFPPQEQEGFSLGSIGRTLRKMSRFFEAIPKQIISISDKINSGFTNAIKFAIYIGAIFETIGTYLTCGLDKIVNIFTTYCLLFYLLDLYINLLYSIFFILFEIETWILQACGIDLDINAELRGVYEIITGILTDIIGYNIFQYPDAVKRKCYNCEIKSFPKFPFK